MSDQFENTSPTSAEKRSELFRSEALDSHASYRTRVPAPNLENARFFTLLWFLFLATLISLIVLTLFQKIPVTVVATAYPIGGSKCSGADESNTILLVTKNKLNIEPGSKVSLIRSGNPPVHGTLVEPSGELAECLSGNRLSPSFLTNENASAFIKTDANSGEDSAYRCYIETGQVYIYQKVRNSLNGTEPVVFK